MPQTIGKFEILRTLGRGAMGEVYLARDPAIGREVALKTILPGFGSAEDLKARFAREAKAAGTLAHPNLVTVFEYGEDHGLLYLAMEYVEGRNLHDLLLEGDLKPAEILEVIAQVCEGLHYAHKHHVIHRDVKPSNVMVQREDGELRAKVMDFGVAKAPQGEMTQTGQVVGTLAYMAPEYLRHGKALPQSDIFSAGVMLFEALSGQKPFSGETTGAMVYNIIHDEPRPLDVEGLEGISPAVRLIVARALAKEPEARFPSGAAFAKALRAARDPNWSSDEDATVALPRASARTASVDRPRRIASPWLVAGALALAAAGGAWWFILREREKAEDLHAAQMAAENEKLSDALLDQASKLLEKEPAEARVLIQTVLDQTPEGQVPDPDAFALMLVVHYRLQDWVQFGVTLEESSNRGVKAADLLKNGRYRVMLERDAKLKHLPESLRQRLLKGQE